MLILRRVLGLVVITLICMVIAFWPEVALYFIYGLIHPTTEVTRIITLFAFWFGGSGLCIGFGFIGLSVWAIFAKALWEVK